MVVVHDEAIILVATPGVPWALDGGVSDAANSAFAVLQPHELREFALGKAIFPKQKECSLSAWVRGLLACGLRPGSHMGLAITLQAIWPRSIAAEFFFRAGSLAIWAEFHV